MLSTVKKLLGPFERIDKADQLQVVAGKIAFNLDWNNSRAGRVSCLYFACMIRTPFCEASFPSSVASSESRFANRSWWNWPI